MKRLKFRQIVWLDLSHMVKLEKLAVKTDLPHNVLVSKIVEVVLDNEELLDRIIKEIAEEEEEEKSQNSSVVILKPTAGKLWMCPYCKKIYRSREEMVECWKSHYKKKK